MSANHIFSEVSTPVTEQLIDSENIINLGEDILSNKKDKSSGYIFWLSGFLFLMLIAGVAFITDTHQKAWDAVPTVIQGYFTSELLLYILGGFIAQMVDGALGMAYGVSSTTFLLSIGVPPAAASASVHASEIFTSGVSGLMHLKFGNVSKKLFRNLLIPGILGAILGAYVLSSLEEYDYILKPIVSTYTLILGVLIIRKAFALRNSGSEVKNIAPLAIFGGFMDSVGGGGWGPIVSSSLIVKGNNPRYTIGSVNLAEFFVALASSLTFITMIGLTHFQIIIGLVLGGVIAAPIAATLTRKASAKTIMIMVGVIVILASSRTLIMTVLSFWH